MELTFKKMAGTHKFGLSTSAIALNAAVFILLSVAASSEEVQPRRCHWCGPLAEQVHRSRRAPACDSPGDHVTTCDPDYTHCAVVATSPPYVESRYCVKLYQDECYPLYCNSTKTWKMTCPCRGDLCNGPNTDRENAAFAMLARLVEKTHNRRLKKRAIVTSSNLINSKVYANEYTSVINNSGIENLTVDEKVKETNTSTEENNNEMQSDEPAQEQTEIIIKNDGDVHQTIAKVDNDINKIDKLADVSSTGEPNSTDTHNDLKGSETPIEDATETTEIKIEDPTKTNDEPAEMAKVDVPVTEATEVKNEPPVEVVSPSQHVPTAEALQQNPSPVAGTEKATETTVLDTTVSTTTVVVPKANIATNITKPTESKKNGAATINGSILVLLYTFIFI